MSKHKQKEGCDNFVSTTPAAINQSSCRKDEERFILSGKRRLEPAMTSLMELLTSFAHALVKSGSECSICIIIPDFCQKLCTVDPLGSARTRNRLCVCTLRCACVVSFNSPSLYLHEQSGIKLQSITKKKIRTALSTPPIPLFPTQSLPPNPPPQIPLDPLPQMLVEPIRQRIREPHILTTALQHRQRLALVARRLEQPVDDARNPEDHVHDGVRVEQQHALDLALDLARLPARDARDGGGGDAVEVGADGGHAGTVVEDEGLEGGGRYGWGRGRGERDGRAAWRRDGLVGRGGVVEGRDGADGGGGVDVDGVGAAWGGGQVVSG